MEVLSLMLNTSPAGEKLPCRCSLMLLSVQVSYCRKYFPRPLSMRLLTRRTSVIRIRYSFNASCPPATQQRIGSAGKPIVAEPACHSRWRTCQSCKAKRLQAMHRSSRSESPFFCGLCQRSDSVLQQAHRQHGRQSSGRHAKDEHPHRRKKWQGATARSGNFRGSGNRSWFALLELRP